MLILSLWLGLSVAAWAAPGAPAPLFDGLGSYQWKTGSRSPLAQRYFDQGMVMAFGFNPEEAARSFEAAGAADPGCGICWWGLAWALGPNINSDMSAAAAPRVAEALRKALQRAAAASPVQREVIAALAARHPQAGGIDEQAYAARMQSLAARFGRDPNVAYLAAESLLNLHPYDWWDAGGAPKPWTRRIVALLERAIARAPDHPGALHYWIHLHESSKHPARAAAAADRLGALVPGSGHLVHMPAHIYLRVGRYADAVAANERSIAADLRYLAAVDAQQAYRVGYVAHNHHFLWAAAAMDGRSRVAIDAARAAWPAACGPRPGDRSSAILQHYYALPLYSLVRFGRWQEILTGTLPPDVDEPYPVAIWHYARGTANARTGRLAQASEDLARLERAAADPRLAKVAVKNINAATRLVEIAVLTLRADIALAQGAPGTAVTLLEQATSIEDALEYDEPHLWLAPTRHALGAALLAAGRADQAERVYREDLSHYPGNGWALTGLAKALGMRGRTDAAREVQQQARAAFARADVVPPGSRF